MTEIHVLKPLGEGTDPATFYAPLGCTTNEGRLYRRDAQYGEDGDDRENWRVEVCFLDQEGRLSGWARSALLMGRGWFVPISTEAAVALEAYMDKLGQVSVWERDFDHRKGSLSGAQSRLKLLKSSDTETDDLLGPGSPKQRKAVEDIAEWEVKTAEWGVASEHADAKRQEAQDVLLTALGWEGLLKSPEEGGGDD